MPDAMDRLQEFNDHHVADALQRHQTSLSRRPGRSTCERLDCGEPIHAARTVQGAQLCVECDEEERKRNAHFAAWRRR